MYSFSMRLLSSFGVEDRGALFGYGPNVESDGATRTQVRAWIMSWTEVCLLFCGGLVSLTELIFS